MSDWILSGGADRPIWEPVRFVDFAGERFQVLNRLQAALNLPNLPAGESDKARLERYRKHLAQLDDEDLALHAILESLFTNATVRLDVAKAETIRLATMRLPLPPGKKRRRLERARQDDILVIVGRMWTIFTSHNFPLNQPALMRRFNIHPEPD